MILIVDYDMGNVGAIRNMMGRMGIRDVVISSEGVDCARAEKIILPGVGSFDVAMRNLAERKLVAPLIDAARSRRVPFLGICLGMQILSEGSEEGNLPGLGLIPGYCRRFPVEFDRKRLRIPHMGWNTVTVRHPHPLFSSDVGEWRYYFVHSYRFVCTNLNHSIGETEYGNWFTSAVAQANIAGVQFHPEKSHRYGMRLLSNFASRT